MKLTQMRYLAAVVQNNLNITSAARELHTSQPGVSKQLKLLEDELGFPIFERDGRSLVRITPAGAEVVNRALRVLEEVANIRRLSEDVKDEGRGSLSIGTTATQARYVLPPVIKAFRARYPDVDLQIHLGSADQLAELARLDRVDVVIATGSASLFRGYLQLPCYRWHRHVVVPPDHPLAGESHLTLATLSQHPVVTYTFSFHGESSLPALFERAGLPLNVALTASDTDVIKTYVRLGFGVGVIASMASDRDDGLVTVNADHLFPAHTTWIGFRRGRILRNYLRDFLREFAPHLTRRMVDNAMRSRNVEELNEVLSSLELPIWSSPRPVDMPPVRRLSALQIAATA
jgi:LysR family cys regulon transcriptional activator